MNMLPKNYLQNIKSYSSKLGINNVSKPKIISNSTQAVRSELVGIFKSRGYSPQRMRHEFESPISLDKLRSLDYGGNKHFKPNKVSDYISYSIVRFLKEAANLYFRKNYLDRVIVLETVAAIPGVVGGLFSHLHSLKHCVDNGKMIQELHREAENERQHYLAFTSIRKLSLLDKFVVRLGQGIFFNFYFLLYYLAPKTAHRFVGYLEEEAIDSYDCFEREILAGNIENVKAPQIAIEYWNLPVDSRLVDVVRAVRCDEAAHRDSNHGFADSI